MKVCFSEHIGSGCILNTTVLTQLHKTAYHLPNTRKSLKKNVYFYCCWHFGLLGIYLYWYSHSAERFLRWMMEQKKQDFGLISKVLTEVRLGQLNTLNNNVILHDSGADSLYINTTSFP